MKNHAGWEKTDCSCSDQDQEEWKFIPFFDAVMLKQDTVSSTVIFLTSLCPVVMDGNSKYA